MIRTKLLTYLPLLLVSLIWPDISISSDNQNPKTFKRPKITISSSVESGSFAYFTDGSAKNTSHQGPYPIDLDGDGIDEVFFAGFESQPNTPATFSRLTVQIFGWENGNFLNLSDKWLPNQAGLIYGTSQVIPGDFNGDGNLDVFLPAYADMEHYFTPFVLLNTGKFLEKHPLPEVLTWQHGAYSADINSDGYDDVYAVGYHDSARLYMGGEGGLTEYKWTDWAGGSGVSLGDFLNNNEISALITDHGGTHNDTVLNQIKIDKNTRTATLKSVSRLPAPIMEDMKTKDVRESHDVRSIPMDFDYDGNLDVIVLSRHWWDGNAWPNRAVAQFLKNLGHGKFVDVTEQFSKEGFRTGVPYNPLTPTDYNKDGLLDIFLDGATHHLPRHDAATILFATPDLSFISDSGSDLSNNISPYGGISTLAVGPKGDYYQVILGLRRGKGEVAVRKLVFANN